MTAPDDPTALVTERDHAEAARIATLAGELLAAEKVDLLSGGFLSNVGLAIADFANQNKRLYVASEPLSDEAARASWQSVLDLQPDSLAAATAKDYLAQLGPPPAETPAAAPPATEEQEPPA